MLRSPINDNNFINNIHILSLRDPNSLTFIFCDENISIEINNEQI